MKLAIDGGLPVRTSVLPYSRQSVSEDDCAAVTKVLLSDWLTTGPLVEEFERVFADFCGAEHAVAVNSGTAALHAMMDAAGIGPGDEVIVPTMTFAATANAVVFCGGMPVFADCDQGTLLIDPAAVERAITPKTKAICAVDYAGQPCDYDALRAIADCHSIHLLADACHALGGCERHRAVGFLADCSTFSFHPVKPMTTGEGGMITTDNAELAKRMRRFRNHYLTSDHRQRHEQGSWFYEVSGLGWNYRLTDFQCALGLSQLKKVPLWTHRRREIAGQYDAALTLLHAFMPLARRLEASHAYHLYVIMLDPAQLHADRAQVFRALIAEGIGVNVHYIPVHLHPFYRQHFGTGPGLCPVAEAAYERMISIPLFAGMTDRDVKDVVSALTKVSCAYAR